MILPEDLECPNCGHKYFHLRVRRKPKIESTELVSVVCKSCGSPLFVKGWTSGTVTFVKGE